MSSPAFDGLRERERALRREASRLTWEADAIRVALHAAARAEFDAHPILDPPSDDEIRVARARLAPYLSGSPSPMIDPRRLRIANRTASIEERREVAAEDVVWKEAGR